MKHPALIRHPKHSLTILAVASVSGFIEPNAIVIWEYRKTLPRLHYCAKAGWLRVVRKGRAVRRPWTVMPLFKITAAGRRKAQEYQPPTTNA